MVAVHFYRLTTLYPWIQDEEGVIGLHAIALDHQWSWRFFYDFGQVPPLSVWASFFSLKMGAGILPGLWWPSALSCVLAALFALLAARRFFPNAVVLIFGFSMALNYWFFILGHRSCQGLWIVPWTCLCAFLLARFLKASPGSLAWEGFGLGLAVGLGFCTSAPWFAVNAWFFLVLAVWARPFRERLGVLCICLAGWVLGTAPFLAAVIREGYGQHIASNALWTSWMPWSDRWRASFSYLTAVFGGVADPGAFDPHGGGELNAFQAVFFLGGLAVFYRRRREPMVQALGGALILFLAPGLLSMGREMYRVVQVLPLLLLISALGLYELLARAPMRWRWFLLALFMVSGALWDGARIFRGLPRPPAVGLAQDWQAFQVLQDMTRHFGPGLILCDFPADSDESLFTVSYPLNAAENPRLDPARARWAALVLDRDYFKTVSPLFPGSSWVWLEPSGPGEKNWVMGLIPLTAANRGRVEKWTRAHHFFWRAAEAIHNINGAPSYREAAAFLQAGQKGVAGDRFLSACYWERLGEFYYHYGYQQHYQDHLNALRQALRQGIPAPHLYLQYGSLLLRKGDRLGAAAAFQAALRLDPQYAPAQAGLRLCRPAAPAP
ncbi:MAG TPA: hypothetical protein VMU88_04870 [bacterium]|nr:hypothetical protein [bacterium]